MSPRTGKVRTQSAIAVASLAVLAAIFVVLSSTGRPGAAGGGRLVLFCAAGIQPPVAELAAEYEERLGTRIDIAYGGSGTLLSGLSVAPEGDLYLAGDDGFVELARERGLVRESIRLAVMRPVIGVAAGNPKGIHRLEDLARDDLVVGLANPGAAAIGKASEAALTEAGLWSRVEANVKVFKPTVRDVASDLVLGSIDAAILWDATAEQYVEIDAVRAPHLDAHERDVTIGVLETCRRPADALAFARFLGSRDIGGPCFERHGYETSGGDPWARVPRVSLMCGAMLNAAIDESITEFEEREGAEVDRVYNGCGILVANMKAGSVPDAYFSCDTTFLDDVQDLFEPGTTVTANRMVILVPSGNPARIRGLSDLSRDGLRVGLAHPERSALGALTRGLLEREGLAEAFDASGNLALDSATGDLLVNQIRTGSLDAVVVYASNAARARDELDLVEIDSSGSLATQPWAVAKGAENRDLLRRLFEHLVRDESRARFEGLGFRWKVEAGR